MHPLLLNRPWLAWTMFIIRDLLIIGLLGIAILRQHIYIQDMNTLKNVLERTHPEVLEQELKTTEIKQAE